MLWNASGKVDIAKHTFRQIKACIDLLNKIYNINQTTMQMPRNTKKYHEQRQCYSFVFSCRRDSITARWLRPKPSKGILIDGDGMSYLLVQARQLRIVVKPCPAKQRMSRKRTPQGFLDAVDSFLRRLSGMLVESSIGLPPKVRLAMLVMLALECLSHPQNWHMMDDGF